MTPEEYNSMLNDAESLLRDWDAHLVKMANKNLGNNPSFCEIAKAQEAIKEDPFRKVLVHNIVRLMDCKPIIVIKDRLK